MTIRDLDVIKEHWEDPNTISLRDENLQSLERHYILEFLKKIKTVNLLADVGCGDGIDASCWRKFAKKLVCYEYSSSMIKKAARNLSGAAELVRFDLLKDDLKQEFDAIITKRCLINLGNLKNQKKAILKIYRSLKPGGYYVMLECCVDGLKNLNMMKIKAGQEPIKEPFHNVYFNLELLKKFIKEYFCVEELRFFSTYYILTRVYSQMLGTGINERLDVAAKEFHRAFDIFDKEVVGPQFLMILKKRR